MLRTLTILAACAIISVPTSAAFAGGEEHYRGSVKDAPVYAPTRSWTGFYVGAAVGYRWGEVETHFETSAFAPYSEDDDTDVDGLTGTVTIGFDRQFGARFVAGVFADYTFGSHDDDGLFTDIPTLGGPVDQAYTAELDGAWAVGGRVGYLVRPQTLLHVNAGYTQIELELDDGDDLYDEDLRGWFVGTGVVHQIRDGLELTFDYRYSDYSEETLYEIAGCCRLESEADVHAIRVGLSYRFGRPAPVHTPLK